MDIINLYSREDNMDVRSHKVDITTLLLENSTRYCMYCQKEAS